MTVRVEHNPEADALYVWLADKPYAYGEDIDHERRIDYAQDGTPVGVEFTCISGGVDLKEIPHAGEIAQALGKLNIRVFA